MLTRVFVYGTLMRGQANHRLLEHAVYLGPGTTEPCFTLASLGPFPAAFTHGKTAVHGELYLVDDATLARLDQLEGCPSFYQRQQATINGECRAEIYVMPIDRAGRYEAEPIQTGDWRQR